MNMRRMRLMRPSIRRRSDQGVGAEFEVHRLVVVGKHEEPVHELEDVFRREGVGPGAPDEVVMHPVGPAVEAVVARLAVQAVVAVAA